MKNFLKKSLMGFMKNKFFRGYYQSPTALFALLHFDLYMTEYQVFNIK